MNQILTLKDEAKNEIYEYIHLNFRKLPKNEDNTFKEFSTNEFIDNDVDALRHAYVSGVYTLEYNATLAQWLGYFQEYMPGQGASSPGGEKQRNMDLWNNSVGRSYGKKVNSREELIKALMKALENNELITDPNDIRKFDDKISLIQDPRAPIIVAKESETGKNILFFDTIQNILLDKSNFLKAIKAGNYANYEIRVIKGEEIPFSKKDGKTSNNLG